MRWAANGKGIGEGRLGIGRHRLESLVNSISPLYLARQLRSSAPPCLVTIGVSPTPHSQVHPGVCNVIEGEGADLISHGGTGQPDPTNLATMKMASFGGGHHPKVDMRPAASSPSRRHSISGWWGRGVSVCCLAWSMSGGEASGSWPPRGISRLSSRASVTAG